MNSRVIRRIWFAVLFRGIPITLFFFIINLPDSLYMDIRPELLLIIFFIATTYAFFFDKRIK